MELKELYETCGSITKSKGFDVSQHATQLCLIATELSEAFEHVIVASNYETIMFIKTLNTISEIYEAYRKDETISHEDLSRIDSDKFDCFLEELADIQIRLASYVSGNNMYSKFEEILKAKIEKNKNRPYLHGKQF